jgi:hypothetical protein
MDEQQHQQNLAKCLTLLRAVSEQAQRVFLLGEMIANHDADEIVAMLGLALQDIAAGSPEARILIEGFHLAVEQGAIDYEQQALLYKHAAQMNEEDICRLLLPPPPKQSASATRMKGQNTVTALPLGTRTWKARRVSGDEIDRFVADPDPSVIENLLKNPYLTESDVVRIVARRPNTDAVIAVVARDIRWQKRYAIRRAIVFNPFTGVDVALRQIPFLNRADLMTLQVDPKVHERVRESASKLAAHRPPKVQRRENMAPLKLTKTDGTETPGSEKPKLEKTGPE